MLNISFLSEILNLGAFVYIIAVSLIWLEARYQFWSLVRIKCFLYIIYHSSKSLHSGIYYHFRFSIVLLCWYELSCLGWKTLENKWYYLQLLSRQKQSSNWKQTKILTCGDWLLYVEYRSQLAESKQGSFLYRKMQMQACEKCNYYENKNRSSGSCRVNPPIVVKDDNKAVWPVVTVNDWCGRFENKAGWTHTNFRSA